MTLMQQLVESLKDPTTRNIWIENLTRCSKEARSAYLKEHNKDLKDLNSNDFEVIDRQSAEKFIKHLTSVIPKSEPKRTDYKIKAIGFCAFFALILDLFFFFPVLPQEEKQQTETENLLSVLIDSTTVPGLEFYSYKNHDTDSSDFVELEGFKIEPPSIKKTKEGLYIIHFPYTEKDSVLYYSVLGEFQYCNNTGFSKARKKEIQFVFEIKDSKNWMEYAQITIDLKEKGAVMSGIDFKGSDSFGLSIGEIQGYFFNKK
jgi:hypothetical protein